MEKKTVDVIIPVYRPGKEFGELLRRLEKQEHRPEKILVMNTGRENWNAEWEKCPILEVDHLEQKDFDHGGTRKAGAALSDADILVFMTQDALPADKKLIGNLIRPLEEEKTGAAYARQLPKEDCRFLECYTRSFNYPSESHIRTAADIPSCGIKTYFCSNVCAAYKREIYMELGGFIRKTIFNEDMIFAAKAMKNGYAVCYAADARVIHSHNYTAVEQFHRNFDLAVSQADHPDVFSGIRSEGEGIRMVKDTVRWLVKTGHTYLVPKLVVDSGFKYMGYLAGKRYKKLPKALVVKLSMNRNYWK